MRKSRTSLADIKGYLTYSASLFALGASFAAPPHTAMAADAPAIDTILVTGTRFSDRTVTSSPVPVDLFTGEQLRQSGYAETSQILRQLTPSFAFANPTTPDGNTHIRSASLRGLSPDETLVLVNGKRLHNAAWVNTGGTIGKGAVPVDLNQIPAAAIGRVEILRDGASAQYGSDAIAGVINLILREDTGFAGSIGGGTTNDGGGDTYEASAFTGWRFAGDGVINTTFFYRDHEAANRALPDTRQFYFGRAPNGALQPLSARFGSGTGLNTPGGVAGTALDPRESTVDRNVWRFADSGDIEDIGAIANLSAPVNANTEVYGFAAYRNSNARSNASFRRPGQDEVVRALYPDGFLPFVRTESDDYSINVGLRGSLGEWQWDLSTIYGGNSIAYRTENTLNATLGTSSPRAFYNGEYANWQSTTSAAFSREFDAGLAAPLRLALGSELRYDGYEIKPGELNSYLFGPARVLDGPSQGIVPTIGSQGFAGIQPGDAVDVDRNAVSAFIELGLEPVEGWQLDLASRYERFNDFGSTTNGSASTRVELVDGFAARASISTGFHAPALAQQYFSSTSSRTIINNTTGFPEFVLVRTAPVGSTLAQALGAVELKPEKSVNLSGGLTYAQGALTASLDYYRINIDDRILLSSNYVDAAGRRTLRDFLAAIGVPGVTSVRYFTNAADTRTQGVDLTLNYSIDLDALGQLDLTGAYNYNKTRLRRVSTTPSQITNLGITTRLFDVIEQTRVERGQPRDKVVLSANWQREWLTVNVSGTRYGKVEQVALTNQTPANVALVALGSTPYRTLPTESGAAGNLDVIQTLKAKWVSDVSINAAVNENYSLTFGANNLFNVYPTKNIASTAALTGADTNGVFPYSEFSPFGFSGAYYYTRLNVKF
jgi:iron complex outermembrane recepter protein